MQRAFILAKATNQLFGTDSNLDELNQMLAEGWSVVQSHPLQQPQDTSRTLYTLLILEKKAEGAADHPRTRGS